ncbi:hypothetical protein Tco_1052930 [Tanacetum coccineum]
MGDGEVRGGRESEELGQISNLIGDFHLEIGTDGVIWSLDDSGIFTVGSVRSKIDNAYLLSRDNSTLCPSQACHEALESAVHLFFECDFAKKLWDDILFWLCISPRELHNPLDSTLVLDIGPRNLSFKLCLDDVFRTTCLWLWKARKSINFSRSRWPLNLPHMVKAWSFHWILACSSNFNYSWSDWCCNPRLLFS